jgi:uncharacterized protein YabN with tetrapyrrole methylase and pyrophosphatase domain
MTKKNKTHQELNDLVSLIKRLRAPDGCPWDSKQKIDDIGKYILEEAYEVVESLEVKDRQALQNYGCDQGKNDSAASPYIR